MFDSIAAIKAANKAAGRHFFDADSMRFFRSRVESRHLTHGRFFVTSEQFVGSDGTADPRKFTVREAHDDGSITSVPDFQSFDTLADAHRHARSLHGKV